MTTYWEKKKKEKKNWEKNVLRKKRNSEISNWNKEISTKKKTKQKKLSKQRNSEISKRVKKD